MKTIRIKPRKGVILAGIPATGADVPAELAEEWLAAKLATRVEVSARNVSRETSKPAGKAADR